MSAQHGRRSGHNKISHVCRVPAHLVRMVAVPSFSQIPGNRDLRVCASRHEHSLTRARPQANTRAGLDSWLPRTRAPAHAHTSPGSRAREPRLTRTRFAFARASPGSRAREPRLTRTRAPAHAHTSPGSRAREPRLPRTRLAFARASPGSRLREPRLTLARAPARAHASPGSWLTRTRAPAHVRASPGSHASGLTRAPAHTRLAHAHARALAHADSCASGSHCAGTTLRQRRLGTRGHKAKGIYAQRIS